MRTLATLLLTRRLAAVACLALAACGGGGKPITGTVSISLSPASATVAAGATQQFTAAVVGSDNTAVTWSVTEAAGGSVSASGLYTAPAAAGGYHVVATSVADATKSASAAVTVNAPAAPVLTPSSVSLLTGATQQFTVTVAGVIQTAIWSVQEGNGGSISSTGLYTAPSAAGVFHVVATKPNDASRKLTALVTVTAAPVVAVSISPTSASVYTGATRQFAATVTGSANTSVTWAVQEGAAGGAVSATGLYTAPGAAGSYHVVATSVADASKSATAAVTVTVPPVITVSISPTTANVLVNGTQQFTASASSGAVAFTVQEQAGGAVDGTGLYTAPAAAGSYHVVATSVTDASKSATAAVTVLQTPATPVVSATASCKVVTLTWASSSTATSYAVSRAPSGSTAFAPIAASPALSAGTWTVIDNDAALAAGTSYDYQVVGSNAAGSGAAGLRTASTGLAAPTGLTLTPGDMQVSIIWTGPAVFPADATWLVRRFTGGSGMQVSAPGLVATSMTDIGLSPSTVLSYTVSASQPAATGCVSSSTVTTGAGGTAFVQAAQTHHTFLSGDGSGGTAATTVVADLSRYQIDAVSFDSAGVPTGHRGVGTADGYFTIPTLPAGNNFVELGGFRGYTTTRQLDISDTYNARADLQLTSLQTDVTTSVTGLTPYTTGDGFELTALGTGFNNDLIAFAKSGAPPPSSATTLSLVDDFNTFFHGLIDTTKGDVLTLTNIASVPGATIPYTALQSFCPATITPATEVDGQPATIGCVGGNSLQPVTPITATVTYTGSQFAAAAKAGAGAGSVLLDSGVSGFTEQGFAETGASYGTQFFGNTLFNLDLGASAADATQSVTYGNPLAPNFGAVIEPAATAGAPVIAASTTACPAPKAGNLRVGNFVIEGASKLGGALTPLVQPVTTPATTVTGPVSDPVFGAGSAVTVSWKAPPAGAGIGFAPKAYRLFLFSLDLDASCNTTPVFQRFTDLWVFGTALSAVIPPRFFTTQDGSHKYAVIVRAYWWDSSTDPNKVGNLFGGQRRGTSEAYAGTVAH